MKKKTNSLPKEKTNKEIKRRLKNIATLKRVIGAIPNEQLNGTRFDRRDYFTKRREELEKLIKNQYVAGKNNKYLSWQGRKNKAKLDELKKAEENSKVWCYVCNGEDLASICKWCYLEKHKGVSLKDFDKFIEELKDNIPYWKDFNIQVKIINELAEKFRGKHG